MPHLYVQDQIKLLALKLSEVFAQQEVARADLQRHLLQCSSELDTLAFEAHSEEAQQLKATALVGLIHRFLPPLRGQIIGYLVDYLYDPLPEQATSQKRQLTYSEVQQTYELLRYGFYAVNGLDQDEGRYVSVLASACQAMDTQKPNVLLDKISPLKGFDLLRQECTWLSTTQKKAVRPSF